MYESKQATKIRFSRRVSSMHYTPFRSGQVLQTPLTSSRLERFQRGNVFRALNQTLDRCDVLEGHTGCVNALDWACDGTILLSGGDDTTVRLWQFDQCELKHDYSLTCPTIINTGHRDNIFNAKMLPQSSRIVTAARDAEIRVFDLRTSSASLTMPRKAGTYFNDLRIATIRCHGDSVKKIATEHSSDLFMSVSEDGTVRQHDLRTPHTCRRSGSCPTPLIDVGHSLLAMSLSSLTPHELVVAGEEHHGYLFDRRHLRRTIENSWGMVPKPGERMTTCVRTFGRPQPLNGRRFPLGSHITSARISDSNGHEVILSYRHDGVYLYSTNDDPEINVNFSQSQQSAGSQKNEDNDILPCSNSENRLNMPMVMPRRRFFGARNARTVKDVNFLGPNDDWIVSGSDDGHFFIWDKSGGNLHGIYEGDSSVVNVVEGHPYLPLVAVSGIDHTIKIFHPTRSPSSFSRMANSKEIMENNMRPQSSPAWSFANFSALQLLADVQT
ncbi:hypothetical protein HYPSUDRAFT_81859 [Hypholoma sublateritium FD-334 SS-4]|uniref:Anaphase-promoting complex subunit 4 WD40 domain-containing protein n=1 Tax=Hypholoma sublateritium (strain FD-334 SS-4) TaxID=945553 RepID=A0A0D2PHB3_HYPSF|nr:hypothetical protein HYPSUDRAFT_81859 [Hypholoma sublateritium FD-334 SS-4]